MAIFPPLAIGRDALLAHERALQVTGHNIANVNTPGFSRQRVLFEAVDPGISGFGRGVRVIGVEQAVDPFLEARRLATASSLGGATTNRELLDRVQNLFPVQGPGIGSALQDFFAAANSLSTHPEELAVRSDVLGRAEALAAQLRGVAGGIAATQREADTRIVQAVDDANGLLASVARLNGAITASEFAGATASDLRDQRREALGALATILDVRVVEQQDGGVNVFTPGGRALVLGPLASTLATQGVTPPAGLDGAPLTGIGLRDAGGGLVALDEPLGGTIGALTTLRDQTLPAHAAALDTLAITLRDAVNAVQTDPAGRDLDGAVGTPLFAGTGAADLTVALGDPRGIAAARSSNPSDNAGALALVGLADTTFAALGGSTLGDYFGTIQSAIGNQARSAADAATVEENVASALDGQRDAVSGVSLEEEFTDLIRFQRGFQAAAQLISTSNRLLDDLFGLVSG
jgi:flagellar hook-associated protein 1 FlgK